MPASKPYVGPVICLTVREGLALLPGAKDPDAYTTALGKIQAARDSDPRWKMPTR
jgi:hypothetical protein